MKQAVAAGLTDGAIGIGYTDAVLSAFGVSTGLTKKAVLDVGWTITIELLFYAHILVFLPWLKAKPALTILLFTGWSILLTYIGKVHPHFLPWPFGVFSLLGAFFPIFSIGMVIYFNWSGRIAMSTATALGVAPWVALILNFGIAHPEKIPTPGSHTTQVAYALFICISALWIYANCAIKNNGLVRFFAKISYSLYLIHLPFGFAISSLVYPRFGLSIALAASFAAVVALSAIIYYLVEKPAQRGGRAFLSMTTAGTRVNE